MSANQTNPRIGPRPHSHHQTENTGQTNPRIGPRPHSHRQTENTGQTNPRIGPRPHSHRQTENNGHRQRQKIEEMTVNLWNWEVAKKLGVSMNKNRSPQFHQLAYQMVYMQEISASPVEATQRQILINLKTGKELLDIGNFVIADEFFQAAMTSLEKLYSILMQNCYTEATLSTHKTTVEKGVLHVLSYQAESAMAQGNFGKASAYALRCKDMLLRLPQMTEYIHTLCYRLGVETYKQRKYRESSFWLSQSFEIGKMDKNAVGPEMLAKVLRLLATVYLDCDEKEYYNKALITILLANKEHLDPAGLFLKMKILSKGETSHGELLEAVMELLHHDLSLECCLIIAKLLMDHERDSVAFCFLRIISDYFQSSEDIGKVVLFHIDMLLRKGQELLAEERIEELLRGHQTGNRLTTDLVRWLHSILWGKAARSFQAQKYADALHWYSYSLKLYGWNLVDMDFIKLKRNMASCYLNLNQLDKAKEAMIDVERHDPINVFTQLCVFKIAVMEGNSDKALQAITILKTLLTKKELDNSSLLESGSSPTMFLSLAVHFALENGQQIVAEMGLEYVCQISEDLKESLAALKCLFRLTLPKVCHVPESENKKKQMKRLLVYLNTALLKFSQSFHEGPSTLNFRICEADWFRKIAWNLALQSAECPLIMKEFFMASYKLSLFCPSDKNLLIAQKTCLLIAAAVDLDQGRKATTIYEQTRLLNQSFEQIEKCKYIWNLLKQEGNLSHSKCEALLLLYEFEIKSKTKDPLLDSFLESLWKIPDLESTTLERIALLAMDKPAHYPVVAQEALRRLLVIHKSKRPIDALKYSLCMRDLIDLSVSYGVSSTVVCPMNEIWCLFRDALTVITHTNGYPEREILWLMIKSWNIGVLMYSRRKYDATEKWTGMALNFLDHLGSLKIHYETQVNFLHAELIKALNKRKKLESEEMVRRSRALVSLPEDQDSVPRTPDVRSQASVIQVPGNVIPSAGPQRRWPCK